MTNLKVFRCQLFVRGLPGADSHHIQAEIIVAAPNKTAAARAMGVVTASGKVSLFQWEGACGGETWNDEQITLAMEEPGALWATTMGHHNQPWARVELSPSGMSLKMTGEIRERP